MFPVAGTVGADDFYGKLFIREDFRGIARQSIAAIRPVCLRRARRRCDQLGEHHGFFTSPACFTGWI